MRSGFTAWARTVASAILGILAAVAAVELGLRPFLTPQGPPTPRVAQDSVGGDTLVRRQLDEGVSIARFSTGGARLTGNPFLPDAPVVVLLGDSYVVARAVADDATMGSVLERDARASGFQLNVRQYGWSGASPSRYLLVADSVLRRWNPATVVIALSDNDLDENALHEANPQLRVASPTDLRILPFAEPQAIAAPRYSSLSVLLETRTWELQWRRARAAEAAEAPSTQPTDDASTPSDAALPDSVQLALLPRAVVHALAAKFKSRLAIVYLAEVRIAGDDTTSTIERSLLAACEIEHVRCRSTRRSMLAARSRGVIARGFFNTTPGNGHLNAAGNALVGADIWDLLSERRVGLISARGR